MRVAAGTRSAEDRRPPGRAHARGLIDARPDRPERGGGPASAACCSSRRDASSGDGFAPLGRTAIGRSAEHPRRRHAPGHHLQRALIGNVRPLLAVSRRRSFCDAPGGLHMQCAFRLERLNNRQDPSPQFRSRYWLRGHTIGWFRPQRRVPSGFEPYRWAPGISLTPRSPHASLAYRMHIHLVRCVFRGEAYRIDTVGGFT